ncbi:gluconate 2-dehydrogenase subunit 3 family protein [Gelidibacter maritimus]|uniref:Gluconate 2-dehydrogenase subunit 3 family protein n=1 Tax=Gelidibacter maritimus TaxID=2761487 RepID=A0A7W2R581_9FLAO|nr:gluconate 2-dehydrogenase subunit 3 family protein [Gelidibacter maritimus]MBA6154647.1 gluconate 2-dehydrogenase subunit 3 family protein [Gelidibacter maritimus]
MDRRTAVKNIVLSLGLVVSGSTILSLFNACTTDKTVVLPEFFKKSDMLGIEGLVDIILPKTSSIGANDLNISLFIDKMCCHVLSKKQQDEIRMGIEKFSKQFEKITNKLPSNGNREDYQQMIATYFDVSEKREKAVFQMLENGSDELAENVKPDYYLYTFLTAVRELGMLGYFTSQVVMEGDIEV